MQNARSDQPEKTLLTLDAGNTEIKCGVFCGGELTGSFRVATEPGWTGDQYASLFSALLPRERFDGAALSCVVPRLAEPLRAAAQAIAGQKPLVVGPGVRTGLDIRIDNPVSMGPDFVCSAVGALEICSPPLVVFDFGTAATLTAIDKAGALVGRLILAGPQTGLDALAQRAAWLPPLRLDPAAGRKLFGQSTADAMQKGALFGAAAMADGLYDRCRDLLGDPLSCLFTGGCCTAVAPLCRSPARVEERLVLRGLRSIWHRNQRT